MCRSQAFGDTSTPQRGGFYVTLRCNLRCKLCAAHAPYYKKPWHPTTEELCTQVDRFFELVTHIGHFSLTGGEPAPIYQHLDAAAVLPLSAKSALCGLPVQRNGLLAYRERIKALYTVDMLSACAYCNGICDDSIRYPAAEQLSV